jgi:hypothetical protein
MVITTIGKVSGEFFVTLRLNLLVCANYKTRFNRNVLSGFFYLNKLKLKYRLCQNLTQHHQSQKL